MSKPLSLAEAWQRYVEAERKALGKWMGSQQK